MATRLLRGLDSAVRGPVRAPRGWPARRRWRVLDTLFWLLLAMGFTGGALGQMATMRVSPSIYVLVGLAETAPLAVAARWPLAAWRVMAIGLLAADLAMAGKHYLWPWPVTAWLAMLFVLFQVRVCHDRWTTVGAGLATAIGAIAPAVLFAAMPIWYAVLLCLTVAAAIGLADLVSGRAAAEASLAELGQLRRQDLARQAVLEERARIARELHDVVAHHMSVIALQAEAAPYKIEELPPAAQRTFEVIVESARAALTETRRIVGVLREDDEAAERVPQPGLAALDGLVAAAGQAGLRVDARVLGVPRPIGAGLDLSAYRIVQEALSNAARYAPGSRVQVTVRYGRDQLGVLISDDGSGTGPVPEPGGGHGLVGMRERVAMLGGTLAAGPDAGGGFAVSAELPYESPGPPRGEASGEGGAESGPGTRVSA